MNSLDANERAETFFCPPKPSCRKPLSRMIKDDSPLQTTRESKKKPRANKKKLPNDSVDSEQFDDSNITDDDEEGKISGDEFASESPGNWREESQPPLPVYEPEGCLHRNPPISPPNIGSKTRMQGLSKSPINRVYDLRNSPNYESAKNITGTYSFEQSESRQRNSSEIPHEKTPRRGSLSKLKETENASFRKMCVYCTIVFGLLIAVFLPWVGSSANSTLTTANGSRGPHRLNDFRHTIKSIKDKFPGQGLDTWMDIEAGIAAVVTELQPISMVILFSNETRLLRCLADDVGSASSRALLSENSLSLEPEDMGDDYGKAIERWRNEIQKKKAVVVHDLLKVDPRAIQALHTMCDRQNPLVKGAVYIMTIVTQDYVAGSQSPNEFVENQLTNRFVGKVPVDKLQPLITRLMDGPVIPVTSEVGRSGCPS